MDDLRDCHSDTPQFGPGGFDPGSLGILPLLHEFRFLCCEDARDRIYALYNLASDIAPTKAEDSADKARLDVHYSLSTQQTYEKLALASLKAKHDKRRIYQIEEYRDCLFACDDRVFKILDMDITFDSSAHIINCVLACQFSPKSDEWLSWVPDWQDPFDVPHDKLLSGWDTHFVEELPEHGIKIAIWCAWRYYDMLSLRSPSCSPTLDLQVDEYPTVSVVYFLRDLMSDSRKFYYKEDLNDKLCATELLPPTCPLSLVLEAMSAFWPHNFTLLSWTSLNNLSSLGREPVFFKANIGPLSFFGVGNKSLRVGDALHSYQHNVLVKVHPDIGVYQTLVLHPVSQDIQNVEATYRLVGTAGVLGPFVGEQPFRSYDGPGRFTEVCLV